jgi:hypothetical protein
MEGGWGIPKIISQMLKSPQIFSNLVFARSP